MKKGVTGFSIIVAAIIAVVLLVIVLLFIRSGLGRSIGTVSDVEETVLSGSTISAVKVACNRFCLEAKASPPASLLNWKISQFCYKNFPVDFDEDGTISSDELINCWQAPINSTCSLTTEDRVPVTEKDCD